jgi:hypothetical protein
MHGEGIRPPTGRTWAWRPASSPDLAQGGEGRGRATTAWRSLIRLERLNPEEIRPSEGGRGGAMEGGEDADAAGEE